MKDFLRDLLSRKEFDEQFWSEPTFHCVVRPPVQKALIIHKSNDMVTITETYVSTLGWLSQPSVDDVEMQFKVDGEMWTPIYLKIGTGKPRFAIESDDGSLSAKPIVVKRQWAFARRWAQHLTVKGLLRGIVEKLDL